MIGINEVVEELVDDVYIRQSKSMDNNELTIDQLKTITGSGPMRGYVESLEIGRANFIRDPEDNCNAGRASWNNISNPWNHRRYNIQGRVFPRPPLYGEPICI